jgi:alkyl hydroperoxide reductase subunit F
MQTLIKMPEEKNNKKQKIHCGQKIDTIIIGGGPAGITAGIYLARRNLCVLIIYEKLGGQASTTADIENYAGFKFITGEEFTKRLNEHLADYDVTTAEEKVEKIEKINNGFQVITNKNKFIGKSVIIASGARQRKLGVPGEEKFFNKGVAYCATCDAPLFRDKEVAIIGGGNSALEAAIQLESYAKKIYIVLRKTKLKGEEILIEKVKAMKNLEIIKCANILEIKGDQFVESIILDQENKSRTLNVQGVFVEIGYIPNSELIDGTKIKKNKYGEIKINNKNETSISGVFAAGDVTDVPVKQIIVAAGEGSKAALSAAEYLSKLNN